MSFREYYIGRAKIRIVRMIRASTNALVSVIMSVFNTPKIYLEESIQSILRQSYSHIEFIIVIDSPDNMAMINNIYKIVNGDNRVKIIQNKHNFGLPKSLNIALQEARGNYIARMDSDDISFHDRLEVQLRELLKNDYDLLSAKIINIREDGSLYGNNDEIIWNDRKVRRALKFFDCMAHPTWFGKKKVFDELGGYRNILACEDYDFLLRALNRGYHLGVINVPCLKYRINKNGISHVNSLRQALTSYYLSCHVAEMQDDLTKLDKFITKYVTDDAIIRSNIRKSTNKKNPIWKKIINLFLYPEVKFLYLRQLRQIFGKIVCSLR